MSQGQEFAEREFVYAGRRLKRDGKVAHVLLKPEALEEQLWYAQKPGVPVGAVFTVEAFEQGDTLSIRFGTVRYDRPYSDSELIGLWRAKDLAVEVELSRKSLNTKASKREPLEDILEPIKELAVRLTASERRALAVRILEVLR